MSEFDLEAALDAAIERKTNDPDTATATVTVSGEKLVLKFTELDGRSWADCTLAGVARANSLVDATFGFNVSTAAELAAPISGVRVDGDKETALTEQVWAKLFQAIDPRGRQAITDAVIAVNENAQIERINAAKKAMEGASKRKRPSRAK